MITVGIETSCDETSAAVLENGRVLSSATYSQLIHGSFGGVVPEVASRAHLQKIQPLCEMVLQKASVRLKDVNLIAVTDTPGLAGALLVGIGFAVGIHAGHGIPVTGINHLEGHICSALISSPDLRFPFLALVVSGGHTSLFVVKDIGIYERLGQTVDDAAGEAFDKVGKMLGFEYPAGQAIEKEAATINEYNSPGLEHHADAVANKTHLHAAKSSEIPDRSICFPVARLSTDGIDFSFSGLKTAVRYYIEKQTPQFIKKNRARICMAFQDAVVEALIQGALRARQRTGIERLALVGGVACNSRLRLEFHRHFGQHLYVPPSHLCTDNAAMIARAGYERSIRNILRRPSMNANGGL